MKKTFFLLFLTSLLFSCKKDQVNDGKLNEPEVLNPKIKELLSNPLIDSVAETSGRITGFFKDGRKVVYNESSEFVTVDSAASNTPATSSSSGAATFVSFNDVQLATDNPASINYTAMVHCELVNGYAMVTSVSAMNMTILNGSTTIYHPGSGGATTTYYTTLAGVSYMHGPVYMPTITLYWNGSKVTRTTTKASSTATAVSNTVYSPASASRTITASIPNLPPPD